MPLLQHLYLTGFRGTGKTSVGSAVCQTFSARLVDLDQVVEAKAGKSIREIFAAGGETAFRDLESAALAEVAKESPAIVSLGGGAILRETNRSIIRGSGWCIWLDADAQTIASRIAQDATTGQRRPALTNLEQADEIRHLLSQRRPLYESAADHRVETAGKSIDEVAAEVATWVRSQT